MKKIGAIGDRQSVQGFAALGIDVCAAVDEGEIRRHINSMAKEGYAVIFITEQAAALAEETIGKFATAPFPAIIPIPGNRGTTGIGMERIRKNVEKAVGTNIFLDS